MQQEAFVVYRECRSDGVDIEVMEHLQDFNPSGGRNRFLFRPYYIQGQMSEQ
jgi:hypothetical protein